MKIFRNYLLVFLVIFFSLFNILKAKLKRIRKCTYMIVEFRKGEIDRRSAPYINAIDLNKSINFIRIPNLNICSFKTFAKTPNSVSFTFIERIFKNKSSLYKLFYKIFIYLNIQKILMIDDHRVTNFFSKLSEQLNIYLILYMHGKISRYDKLIKHLKFSKYLVWSEYFKKNILKSNSSSTQNDIIITGNPNLKKFTANNGPMNSILILDEDYVLFKNIKPYLLELIKLKNYKLFLKKKITRNLPGDYILFCKENFISIVNEESLLLCLRKYKVSAIIAFSSTGLLEASYYGVLPIKLKDNNTEFNQFVEERLVYEASYPKKLSIILNKSFNQNRIKKIKSIVWNGAEFDKSKLKNTLIKFF
jgi:hypothetical protein